MTESLSPDPELIKHEKRIDYALLGFHTLLFGAAFPPFNNGYFAWIAFIPYLFFLERNLGNKNFKKNFAAGYLSNLLIIYWVGLNSGVMMPIAVLTLLGVLAVLALWFAFFGWVIERVWKRWGEIAIWAVPFIWVGIEFIRGHGSLALPWTMVANTQTYYNSLIQITAVTGAWGVSLFVMFVNILGFKAMKSIGEPKRAIGFAIAALLALALPWSYGIMVLDGADERLAGIGKSIRVSIVQPNLDPKVKWDKSKRDSVYRLYGDMHLKAGESAPDLIIWPETATPAYLRYNRDGRFDQVLSFVDSVNVPLLTGTLDYKFIDSKKFKKYNSSFLLKPGSREIEKYHKMRLVPFAEKVPFEDRFPFLSNIDLGQANFSSGEEYKVFDVEGKKFSVQICFESTFPSLTRNFVLNGAEMLLIITNDAWFGNSSQPYQHAQIAVMRAVESRRAIARSANTGISEIIDPYGRIKKSLAFNERGIISGEIPLMTEKTFYVKHGDYLGWITTIITLILLGLTWIKESKNE